MDEPLLPGGPSSSDNTGDLSKLQPCANFLLNSKIGVWYQGEIHKQIASNAGMFKEFIQGIRNINNEKYTRFVSYKFEWKIKDKKRTFCVTFRKERYSDYDNVGGFSNVYLIRVSLIEKEDNPYVPPREDNKKASRQTSIDIEIPIKCRGSESLIIKINSLRGGNVILPKNLGEARFSSITSGDTPEQIAVVRGMEKFESPETDKFNIFFKTHIEENMNTLGEILVDNCEKPNSSSVSSSDGGATRKHTRLTRRRKGVFKRKGKKSYKKKKYGKTKKSRRFKRSGRSRR